LTYGTVPNSITSQIGFFKIQISPP
jgi:hypothetical protein